MSRPSTVRVACRIEARMIPPESTTVPSRSKRTTGKRMRAIVWGGSWHTIPSVGTRPGLAVAGPLAAGGAVPGGFYLWPSGRHLADCPAVQAPVPAAAQKALAAYAGLIRHEV